MAEVEKINPYLDDTRAKNEQVRSMFDSIAPAYDFMNRAMSFGMDRVWLRCLVKEVSAVNPATIADLATGTGDVAFALVCKLPDAVITGIDLSEKMLSKARAKAQGLDIDKPVKISFMQGDCLATGMPSSSVDAVTIAYGVRNFADIAAGYREMFRILRPGGKLCVLELSTPTSKLLMFLYKIYTRTLIPFIGRLMSHDSRAYSYLPESIVAAPQRADMASIMASTGFERATFHPLTFGVCTLYTAQKPE